MEILETLLRALCCPGAGQGPRKAAVRGAPGQSRALAEGRTVTLSHAPPRTACPNTPPVGTESFIVRDVQFSDEHWDFSGFSTSTKASQAALKDIWPSDQERPLQSVNSILTLHQDGAHSAGQRDGSALSATKKQD